MMMMMVRAQAHEDDLEQHLLVDLHELLVPIVDIGRFLARVGIVIVGRWGIGSMVDTPFDDLVEHHFVHLPI